MENVCNVFEKSKIGEATKNKVLRYPKRRIFHWGLVYLYRIPARIVHGSGVFFQNLFSVMVRYAHNLK